MTHPALFSLADCISALDVALQCERVSIIDRRVLQDMRDDLANTVDFDTFEQLVKAAEESAKRGLI